MHFACICDTKTNRTSKKAKIHFVLIFPLIKENLQFTPDTTHESPFVKAVDLKTFSLQKNSSSNQTKQTPFNTRLSNVRVDQILTRKHISK